MENNELIKKEKDNVKNDKNEEEEKLHHLEEFMFYKKIPSLLVPPLNFAMVSKGIYRSGFPNKKNFAFLKKLKLKSIMYLSPDEYFEENYKFMKENNIQFFQYKIEGNKEPFKEISYEDISNALTQVLDTRNLPMLIHCNKGRHRVGCLIGCLRKLQNYSMNSIFDEYIRYAGPKLRISDQEFIEIFPVNIIKLNPEYLPESFLKFGRSHY
jgi:tyrosine-protein phosphatase SIW14